MVRNDQKSRVDPSSAALSVWGCIYVSVCIVAKCLGMPGQSWNFSSCPENFTNNELGVVDGICSPSDK